MPKDELDFDDPLELTGVGLVCEEDTTGPMTESFIEEYMRLGYGAKQILALFQNPHYIGMNMVVQNRGEQFVRDYITEVFARWGKPVPWRDQNRKDLSPAPMSEDAAEPAKALEEKGKQDAGPALTDPFGASIPDLTI